jgi:fermentation-respiration switch protein FrsA (DUF1100 family)
MTGIMAAGLFRIALLLLAVYVAAAIAIHFLSLAALFPRPPASYALTPDLIQLRAADGTRVVCGYWPNPAARFTLLWFHGNGEDLGAVAENLAPYRQAGFAILAMEYRGYGQSGGTPGEASTLADARLSFVWLNQQGTPPGRIILFGYSLVGGPAVELAVHQPVAGLVLQSCFVSAYRALTRVPLFPGDKFENLKKLPQVRCPVLVIHGTADEVVPFWNSEQLYAAAPGRKFKLFVEGGTHRGLADQAGEAYWRALREFTSQLSPSRRARAAAP